VSKALAGAQISLRKTLSDLKQAAYKAGCEISGLIIDHRSFCPLGRMAMGDKGAVQNPSLSTAKE
jgi:hypothetical protein